HKILLERNKPTIDALNKLEEQYKRKEIADTTYKRLALKEKGAKEALTVLIKADDKAVYKNVIDAIDELNICNVGKYAIVDMSQPELNILNEIKEK
ncbi:MAG TPA: biopolymer transporter ExbD, partial [Bacteroidia bacterium]|nr:biopolymer transporter ExbD [Bacteroidia bacterium]